MIKRLYELVTGTPWTTVYGGPTWVADYPEFTELTDAELMAMTSAQAVAWAHDLRARRAATAEAIAYAKTIRNACDVDDGPRIPVGTR